MVSVSSLVGLAVVVAVNALVAALAVRYFRYRLETRWGAVVFTAVLVPVLYVATTLFLTGFLGLGGGLFESVATLLLVTWALPFALGASFDYFWMPAPDEVELPAATEQE
jgi:hypothetical protein